MSDFVKLETIRYHGKVYQVLQESGTGYIWYRDNLGHETSVGKVRASSTEEACEIVRRMLDSLGY